MHHLLWYCLQYEKQARITFHQRTFHSETFCWHQLIVWHPGETTCTWTSLNYSFLIITSDDASSGDCSHARDNHLDPAALADICIPWAGLTGLQRLADSDSCVFCTCNEHFRGVWQMEKGANFLWATDMNVDPRQTSWWKQWDPLLTLSHHPSLTW